MNPGSIISILIVAALFFVFGIVFLYLPARKIRNQNNGGTKGGQLNKPSSAIRANEDASAAAQKDFLRLLAKQQESQIRIDEETEAKLFAQAVELQTLKAPATAQFCELDEMEVTRGWDDIVGNVYIVSGHVDAQNSYAALIRSRFTIRVFKQNSEWKTADTFVSAEAVATATVQKIQKSLFQRMLPWIILFFVVDVVGLVIWLISIGAIF